MNYEPRGNVGTLRGGIVKSLRHKFPKKSRGWGRGGAHFELCRQWHRFIFVRVQFINHSHFPIFIYNQMGGQGQQTVAGQGNGVRGGRGGEGVAESRSLFIHAMWEIWMRLVRLKIVRFAEIFMRLHERKKLPRSMDKVFPVFHSHIIPLCVYVCVCVWEGG